MIQLPRDLGMKAQYFKPINSVIKDTSSVFGGRPDGIGYVRDGVYLLLEQGKVIGSYVEDNTALTVKELQQVCEFYKIPYTKKDTKDMLLSKVK